MRSRTGVSFTEVMFAMVILVIGLLAMAIVQVNTLRNSRRAEVAKEARVLAEAEVDRRRSVTLTTGAAQNCLVTLTAVDVMLDTGAADDEPLISFQSIGVIRDPQHPLP